MSANTNIEWCDHTVNFWAGCTKISPACDSCYAEKMAGRLWGVKWGAGMSRRFFDGACETLGALNRKAARLGTKPRVFINSMSDVFDNEIGDEARADAFEAMSLFKNLTFLILTKRIGNVAAYLKKDETARQLFANGDAWLGATIVNQPEYDRDIGKLLRTPAAVHFLSVEPMLGAIDMRMGGASMPDYSEHRPLAKLGWVICGGESGPQARPMHPDWACGLRDQCEAAGVPFLFKQWGEWCPRGPESLGYPSVDGVPRVRLTDAGHNGQDLASDGGNDVWMNRAGKKAAGRLLDGVEHNGYPESAR